MPDLKTNLEKDQRPYYKKLRPLDRKNLPYSFYRGKKYIDLSHNDYLGLSQDTELIKVAQKTLKEYGNGSGGSRLLGGDYPLFHNLETLISKSYQKESALFFNNGYQGNIAVIAGLFGPKDIIFADKYCHASCLDACRFSGVQLKRFAHQDMQHLENRLKRHRKKGRKSLIVSDALFSMQGDFCSLKSLILLKKEYDCQLMIDEAHSLGVYGLKGLGFSFNVQNEIDFIFGTFGKALGSSGAFVTCSMTEKQQLLQKARSLIYSTALPRPVISWNYAAFLKIQKLGHLREKLIQQANDLRLKAQKTGFENLGNSHIIPLRFSKADTCLKARDLCLNEGVFTHAIFPPTVPDGQSQLRWSLNVMLQDVHMEKLQLLLPKLRSLES